MNPVRIWIIEDNAADALLVDVALKHAGLATELTRINDGAHALRMIEEARSGAAAPPHIVLLDLNLPRVGGVDVLRAIRACPELSSSRIAVFIAGASGKDRRVIDEIGVDCHLDKPADLDGFSAQIVRAVKELLPPLSGMK